MCACGGAPSAAPSASAPACASSSAAAAAAACPPPLRGCRPCCRRERRQAAVQQLRFASPCIPGGGAATNLIEGWRLAQLLGRRGGFPHLYALPGSWLGPRGCDLGHWEGLPNLLTAGAASCSSTLPLSGTKARLLPPARRGRWSIDLKAPASDGRCGLRLLRAGGGPGWDRCRGAQARGAGRL
jgi:hypothetical protein